MEVFNVLKLKTERALRKWSALSLIALGSDRAYVSQGQVSARPSRILFFLGMAPALLKIALMVSGLQINGKDAKEDRYLEGEVGKQSEHNA